MDLLFIYVNPKYIRGEYSCICFLRASASLAVPGGR
jgi:hypothetical protein